MTNKKILVAYFSASGNTATVAKKIATKTGADLYEIKPTVPYTSADLNWNNKSSRSSVEMNNPDSRPEIANKVADMDSYDTVLVGFPVWWYVAPTIINTFLESYDFSGKEIALFATSGGSGLGKSEQVLKSCVALETKWLSGKRLSGSRDADKWVQSLGL